MVKEKNIVIMLYFIFCLVALPSFGRSDETPDYTQSKQNSNTADNPESSPIRKDLVKEKQDLIDQLGEAREREKLMKRQEELIKRRAKAMGEFEPKTVHRPGQGNNYEKWERDQEWGGNAPPNLPRNGDNPEELEQSRKDHEEWQANQELKEFVKENGEKIAQGKGSSPKDIERQIKEKEKEIEKFDKKWHEGPAEEPPPYAEESPLFPGKQGKTPPKKDKEELTPSPYGTDGPGRWASATPKQKPMFSDFDALNKGGFGVLANSSTPTATLDSAPQSRNMLTVDRPADSHNLSECETK